jgi:hypothetical protein
LKSGLLLPSINITDLAPTAALLGGIHAAPESNGLVLWNALLPGNGLSEEDLLRKRIKNLSDYNVKLTGLSYRLEEEKSLVKIEKEKVLQDKNRIKELIDSKDRQIRSLKWKGRLIRVTAGVIFLTMGAGYVIEYYYLRKKFLMF